MAIEPDYSVTVKALDSTGGGPYPAAMENTLRYPYDLAPAEGECHEVAEGIYWLRFPLPYALDHVNAWMIEDGDGWFVIDSGIGGARMHEIWDGIIETHFDGKPITRLLITHFHPDHIGSAGYLCARFAPELLMTAPEWRQACHLKQADPATARPVQQAHYDRLGVPPDILQSLLGSNYASRVDDLPADVSLLNQDDTIIINCDSWQVLVGGGHAPAQAMLYCAKREIFISADQVLPRISPNVSAWADQPSYNAVGAYLHSLESLKHIPDDPLVLPSHHLPFYGLQTRIQQLEAHHAERLEQIVGLVDQPLTIYELTRRCFRRELEARQLPFALGEILAHCNHLIYRGQIARIEGEHAWQFVQT